MAFGKKENHMYTKKPILWAVKFLTVLALILTAKGTALAQDVPPSFLGKFTLTAPVHWGKSVLQPGDYTICIDSMASPSLVLINKEGSAFAVRVMSGVSNDYRGGSDALQLKVKNGEFVVHALVLADLKRVFIYDSFLEGQNVEEVRASASLPVLAARK